jgi:hypothetical protein
MGSTCLCAIGYTGQTCAICKIWYTLKNTFLTLYFQFKLLVVLLAVVWMAGSALIIIMELVFVYVKVDIQEVIVPRVSIVTLA